MKETDELKKAREEAIDKQMKAEAVRETDLFKKVLMIISDPASHSKLRRCSDGTYFVARTNQKGWHQEADGKTLEEAMAFIADELEAANEK